MRYLGARVLRGPDWDQDDADGGEGHLGTVLEVKAEEGTAEVVWDNGQIAKCRVGKEGKHDLRIYDSASAGQCTSRGVVCQGCRNSSIYGTSWRCSTCSNLHLCSRCYHLGVHPLSHHFLRQDNTEPGVAVGTRSGTSRISVFGIFPEARVARGHDWQYGDIDGGPDGSGVVVEVVSPKSGSARNAVRVSWDSGQSLQHRLGLHGKVDLVCTEEAPGPACYLSHLPVLTLAHAPRGRQATSSASSDRVTESTKIRPEKNITENDSSSSMPHEAQQSSEKELENRSTATAVRGIRSDKADSNSVEQVRADCNGGTKVSQMKKDTAKEIREDRVVRKDTEGEIGVGDRVEVGVDFDTFRDIQTQTASWTNEMAECLGRTGVVKSVAATGEMEVDFEGHTWKINPISLRRATETILSADSFNVGDTVRIISDARLLEQLQEDHGGWNSSMAEAAGKLGKVKKVTPRGDVEVSLGQQSWVFNPQSCRPAPGCPTHLHSEDPMDSFMQSLEGGSQGILEFTRAVREGNTRQVTEMLDREPELIQASLNGATALHFAANEGQTEMVRLLVAKGADLQRGDKDNDTPLTMAAMRRRVETARVLLELGSNVHHANKNGSTVLHLAVRASCPPLLPLLLQHGASVNAKDKYSMTPLFLAIADNADMDIIVPFLAVDDLDLRIPNVQEATALHLAVYRKRTSVVEKLLTRDSSVVHCVMEQRITPLHLAVEGKHPDITRLLLRANAPIEARSHKGLTPLHTACIADHLDMARILLDHGADLHSRDDDSDTPLHLALGICATEEQTRQQYKGVELAKFLIERGARLDLRNNKGQTPLETARRHERQRLECFLKDRDAQNGKKSNADDNCNVSPGAGHTDPNTLHCITCHQREADVIFLPCAHKLVCRQCVGSAKNCRECGIIIEGIIDTDGNLVGQATISNSGPMPKDQNADAQQDCKVQ